MPLKTSSEARRCPLVVGPCVAVVVVVVGADVLAQPPPASMSRWPSPPFAGFVVAEPPLTPAGKSTLFAAVAAMDDALATLLV
jgi:hypothetical protein